MLVFSLLPSLGYSLLWWKVCYQDEMGVFRGRTKAWRVTPLCLFQIIWQEWKRKSFDRMEQPDLSPKNSVSCSLSWVLFSFSSWSFFLYFIYWLDCEQWVGGCQMELFFCPFSIFQLTLHACHVLGVCLPIFVGHVLIISCLAYKK